MEQCPINKCIENFKILSNDALFKNSFDADADAFNHDAYAKALHSLIRQNEPPKSIGLFGGWGIGKTTIINALINKLREDSILDVVYFNAWKYSGDSFRREFLLTVANDLEIKEEEKERIKSLFYTTTVNSKYGEINNFKGFLRSLKDERIY